MINVKILIAGAALAVTPWEQSVLANLANTGVNVDSAGADLNWNVSSPNYTGSAYVATPSDQWPFSTGGGPWVADDTTSSWITYSTPLNLSAPGAQPATTYTYTETFSLSQAGTLDIRFLSDNESTVYLINHLANGDQQTSIAHNGPAYDPSTFTSWTYASLSLGAGTYSFQVDVNNDYWPYFNGNPTGFRFEQSLVVSAVPEPATIVVGVLMLVPLGIGFLRTTRREGSAMRLN